MRRGGGVLDSRQSYTLVVSHQKLNPLELVQLELKLLFDYSAGGPIYARYQFQGQFFASPLSNIVRGVFDELAVPSGVDCALFAGSWMVTDVAELHGTV